MMKNKRKSIWKKNGLNNENKHKQIMQKKDRNQKRYQWWSHKTNGKSKQMKNQSNNLNRHTHKTCTFTQF